MARLEANRRYDISENQLDQEKTCNSGVNPYTKEMEKKYVCPECGHHALALSPKAGFFHCWSCGIWGRTVEKQEEIKKEWELRYASAVREGAGAAGRQSGAARKQGSGTCQAADKGYARKLRHDPTLPSLDDYISIDAEELENIELLTLDSSHDSVNVKAVKAYLEQQHIPLQVAVDMRIGATQRIVKCKGEDKSKSRACIAYLNHIDGYDCNVKFRTATTVKKAKLLPDGSRISRTTYEKGFDQVSAFTPCAPYNIDCLRPQPGSTPTVLYVTEGEKDCLTLRALGLEYVISAASGAQTDHHKSFQAFREWLEPIQTVIAVGDQDTAGRIMTQNLAEYFDDRDVKICMWDKRQWGKDISEVYQRHGREAALQMIQQAQPVVREDIEDFQTTQAVQETIQSAMGQYDHGYSTGIGPVTDSHFKLFDLGGLIVVTGTPNTGKTDFLNFLSMSLLNQRHSHVCFCSFETPNKSRHAGDLTQIWAGGTDLTHASTEEVQPLANCVMKHITHLRMRKEKPTPEAVLRKAELVKRKHPKMEFLIIDPYLYLSMTVGRNITETDSIKAMLTSVQEWAHEHHVWVFIVAHPRKLQKDDGSKELEEVDMYTIAGSANWANVADYVISVKRIQTKGMDNSITADYTRLSVLKVRDQKICMPGDVFYRRQYCGRYDERATEKEAASAIGTQNLLPYPLFDEEV